MSFKLISTVALTIGFSIMCNAQITGAGIQGKYNFARQLNVIQNIPKKFARTGTEVLATPGVDAYVDYSFNEKWLARLKSGIETKGFTGTTGSLFPDKEAFEFHYWSTDLSISRKYGNNKLCQPYNYLGVSTGYLYSKNAEDLSIWANPEVFPEFPENYDDYSKFNLGLTAGVGLSFGDILWLELEYNKDLIAPLKTDILHISNYVYSINVGVNVLKIINKKPFKKEEK